MSLPAQTPVFRPQRLQEQSENLQTTVLFQDKQGWIWCGTEQGLFRYDGFTCTRVPAPDSLDRALQSVPEEGRDQLDEATRNLLAGIEVTHKELLNVFSRYGINRIEPMGEKFDPHFHQAMFEVPDPSAQPGTVVQIMQAGYTIGERCLRPALVGVAKAPAEGQAGKVNS